MTQLYKIADEYREAFENLMDEDGVMDDMALQKLDSIADSIEKKGISVAHFMKNLDADLEAVKAERDRLDKKYKSLQQKALWINGYLKGNMERCGITQIACPYFTIKIKKSPPAVEIFDRDSIPEDYLKTEVVVKENKAKMREDLKNGTEIPGARLSQGTWLDIK